MDDLHLKGNIYHGKETVEQSSSGCIRTVLVSFVPVCVCMSVCVAHQQCLFYIHWGIRWGTIHAPWGFL